MEYYVVDAFTRELFGGNPAGVCLADEALPERLMQTIAAENNLSETAFVVENGGAFDLRWFTPETEIDLCGHATLATAYVLNRFRKPRLDAYRFNTMSGELVVTAKGDLLEMDFPAWPPKKVEIAPGMADAIGAAVLEAHLSRDLILLVDSAETVRTLKPDMARLEALSGSFAIVVTAEGGDGADFVSRFFAPGAGVPEDPVTGSSHSTLIPFWSSRLGRKEMTARQLSKRGGTLYCRDAGPRVFIGGHARLYLQGTIDVQ